MNGLPSRCGLLVTIAIVTCAGGCVRGGFAPAGTSDGAAPPPGDAGDGPGPVADGDSGDLAPVADAAGDGADGAPGGQGVFVLYGEDGRRLLSHDRGETWPVDQRDPQPAPAGSSDRWLVGAAHSATHAVLAGGPWAAVGGFVLVSADGTTWSEATIPQGQGPLGIAHGKGKFVTINNVGDACVSSDGASWTQCNSTQAFARGICFGQGRFFAAGDGGRLSTSTDGLSWQTTVLGGARLEAVACGPDRFVAVGPERRVTTLDGLTVRSDVAASAMGTRSAVAFGGGLFVDSACRSSADGETWSESLTMCARVLSLTHGEGVFLAVDAETPQRVLRSIDGRSWQVLGTLAAGPAVRGVGFVRLP